MESFGIIIVSSAFILWGIFYCFIYYNPCNRPAALDADFNTQLTRFNYSLTDSFAQPLIVSSTNSLTDSFAQPIINSSLNSSSNPSSNPSTDLLI